MSKKRRNKPVATGIKSDCDVCGGFMFNAKRYMYMDDAYFTSDQVTFQYEAKKISGKSASLFIGFGPARQDI